ncbi:hypothetical protein BOH72_26325 [Mycobacterium sp. WY10]|nr:hypothetical protein BOH72_26325 [Mycobacterium sp. WY10]
MTAPRPHWTTAQIQDILPVDLDAHAVGGLVDLYLDTNAVAHQRVRLTVDQAVGLVAKITRELMRTA